MFTKTGNFFGEKEFGTNQTTMKFFLTILATCNFYYFAWIFNLVKEVNEKQTRIKINEILPFVITGLSFWGVYLQSFFIFFIFNKSTLETFTILINLGSLTCFGLIIYLSFKTRAAIHIILLQQNLYVPLNIFFTIIFPLIYQYYCLRNAEERFAKNSNQYVNTQPTSSTVKSKTEQLEELAKLKETGVLSEEEFQAEKKKILEKD